MQHNLNFDTEKQPLWDLVSKYGSDFSKNHAHRTIAQLVKLGLLQKVKSNRLDLRGRSLLALSLKGDATYAYISNRPEILETDPDIQKLVSSDPSP